MPDGTTTPGTTPARFGSGREVKRIEDASLLSGHGRFTDDFTLPNQTWLAFLRSPVAHAAITSIDVAAAVAMPGVVAVYTGADLVAAGHAKTASGTDVSTTRWNAPARRPFATRAG